MMQTLAPRSKKEVAAEIKKMRDMSRKILKTKNGARDFLLKHGFIDKSGQLAKKYRS